MLDQLFEQAVYNVSGLKPNNSPTETDYENIVANEQPQGVIDLITQDHVILSDRRKYDIEDFLDLAKFISPAIESGANLVNPETQSVVQPQDDFQIESQIAPAKSIANEMIPVRPMDAPTPDFCKGIVHQSILGPAKAKLLNKDIESLSEFTDTFIGISKALQSLGYTQIEIMSEIENDSDLSSRVLSLYISELKMS